MGVYRAVLFGLTLGFWSIPLAGRCVAQNESRMNLYRFLLGVDVPAQWFYASDR